MNQEEIGTKVTANVNSDIYDVVTPYFHYGQRGVFFNKLFESLKILIDAGEWNKVVDYMYNNTELLLPTKKD
jgi:hypothetical protein